jgi:hypothetical protein
MNAELATSLVNVSAAVAVIIVVSMFLSSNEKRDKEWRDFFVTINQENINKTNRMSETLSKLVDGLQAVLDRIEKHDDKVTDNIRAIQAASRANKRSSDKE